MSTCNNLICRDCKEILWIGQGGYIYTTPEAVEELTKFLWKHQKHHLSFMDDHNLDEIFYDVEDYPNWKGVNY